MRVFRCADAASDIGFAGFARPAPGEPDSPMWQAAGGGAVRRWNGRDCWCSPPGSVHQHGKIVVVAQYRNNRNKLDDMSWRDFAHVFATTREGSSDGGDRAWWWPGGLSRSLWACICLANGGQGRHAPLRSKQQHCRLCRAIERVLLKQKGEHSRSQTRIPAPHRNQPSPLPPACVCCDGPCKCVICVGCG